MTNRFRGRSLVALCSAGVLVLVAASCAKSTESSTSSGAPPSSTSPTVSRIEGELKPTASPEFLRQAAKKTASNTSGAFELTMEVLGTPKGDVVFASADGSFDNAKKQAQMTMRFDGLGDLLSGTSGGGAVAGMAQSMSQPLEMVSDGSSAYLKWPLLTTFGGADPAKPWVKVNAGSSGSANPVAGLVPVGGDGPTGIVQAIEGAGGQVTEVGTEDLDGVSVHHYKAVIDPKASAASAHLDDPDAKKAVAALGDVKVPIDVWVGDDGVVRKVTMDLDLAKLPGTSGAGSGSLGVNPLGSGKLRLTMTVTKVGEPVTVTVPPADQVQELKGLPGAGGTRGGSGSGGGSTRRSTTTVASGGTGGN